MVRWLEAVGEGFVGDEDDFCAQSLGFASDGLLRMADEGRDEYGSAGGGIEPVGFLPGILLFRKAAADSDRLLVGIAK